MIGWEVLDGIGVLTLANPPLNLVTLEQTQRLHQALDAAFAVPDERLGEKVCLAVIPVEGRDIEPDALLAHLAGEGLS